MVQPPVIGGDRGNWGQKLIDWVLDQVGDSVSQSEVDAIEAIVSGNVAAIEDLSEPGDPGDLKGTATDGVTITNLKPGRIDARVRGLSTASSDVATLLATLVTESATEGSELWIPEGTYRTAKVDVPSNARINGTGTIKSKATSPTQYLMHLSPSGDSENVSIEGITFDGNGTSAALVNVFPNSVNGLTVRGCTFQNLGPTFEYSTGIRLIGGTNMVIEANTFDGGAAMLITNVDHLKVRGNRSISAITNNAISIHVNSAYEMRGLEVSGNILLDCMDMGIELVDENGNGAFHDPIIHGNDVVIANSYTGNGFGISINRTHGGRITGNTVDYLGSGTLPPLGIEPVWSRGVLVAGNTIRNCQTGAIANNASDSVFRDNWLLDCYKGMTVETSTTNSLRVTIDGNRVINPRDFGIQFIYFAGSLSGGHMVTNNVINRSGQWSGDAGRTYLPIQLQRFDIPSVLRGNRIVSSYATPNLTFNGGIHAIATLGLLDDTVIEDTQFQDLKTSGTALTPLNCNNGSGAVADVVLSRNLLVDASGTKSAVTSW